MDHQHQNLQRGLDTQVNQMQAYPRVDGSLLLEEEDDEDYLELSDLKSKHERLVDTILEEEDNLITSHHNFIEITINSSKYLCIILL